MAVLEQPSRIELRLIEFAAVFVAQRDVGQIIRRVPAHAHPAPVALRAAQHEKDVGKARKGDSVEHQRKQQKRFRIGIGDTKRLPGSSV